MTATDLDQMSALSAADPASNVSAYQWGGYFVLGADIDYGGKTFASWCGYSQWSDGSVDTSARGFIGVFDGRNYTISNLSVSGSNAGFIAC